MFTILRFSKKKGKCGIFVVIKHGVIDRQM